MLFGAAKMHSFSPEISTKDYMFSLVSSSTGVSMRKCLITFPLWSGAAKEVGNGQTQVFLD